MDPDFPPGVVGVADDMLDISGTVWTFHDESAVHVDRTEMFNRTLSAIASDALRAIKMMRAPMRSSKWLGKPAALSLKAEQM